MKTIVVEMGGPDERVARGVAFLEGDGVAKDYEQAYYWLSSASELGSDLAESLVRDMRRMSLGTPYGADGADWEPGADDKGWSPQSGAPASKASACTPDAAAWEPRPANPDRCIACGTEALIPSASVAGALSCSPGCGGCGATSMIPIFECGLDRGLALQPYSERAPDGRGNVRSSLGALVHMVKYDSRVDDSLRAAMLKEVVGRIRECGVVERLVGDERRDLVVVPAPSSKRRRLQPVSELARLMADGRFGFEEALAKRSSVESKNRPRGTELEPGDVRCLRDVRGKAVLLVDDTYGEGATLRACVRALREGGAREVYFLSLCKNMFGGMKVGAADDDDIH